MIERVIIKNYKCIKDANITFNNFKNIIVGNNGVGKSTLMEAISLALRYGLNKFEVTPSTYTPSILHLTQTRYNSLTISTLLSVRYYECHLHTTSTTHVLPHGTSTEEQYHATGT
ncbi:ATP-binding protein [Prevotellamassilia timonensis]|uniref:ATP-binding protein n=1 Tax=Prevotellamassilia timonensis TaxID=1852370 RepID=UPI003077AC40